jgi:hypothetical protein
MIARTLENLADKIRGKPGISVVPGFLRPINTDAIARDERLDAKAADNGRSDLPDSNARQHDAPEQAVTQKVLSEWGWQGEAFLNELRAYASRLAQYSIHSEHERLVLKAKDALAKLGAVGIRAEAELGHRKRSYLEAYEELTDFRERHRLKRPARDKSRRWTAFGLMVVLVAFESVLNGLFFAKGANHGILGGVGTALGISVVNVLFAFLLGYGPARWINYRNFVVRAFALLLTVAGSVLIVSLHGFAVHFREAMVAVGEDRAFVTAVESLLRTPWRVTDLTSLYLFGLGLLFAFGAFWKGCTFEDPYPGYGPMYRREAAAREDYSEHHADLFDELEDIKDDTVADLDSSIKQIPIFPQLAEKVRSERAALTERFKAYETSVEAAANQLLALYRTANRKARKKPPPAYFDELWKLPHRFVDSTEAMKLVTDPEPPPLIEPILSEFRALSQQILDEYTKLIQKYPHPTAMQKVTTSDGATQAT